VRDAITAGVSVARSEKRGNKGWTAAIKKELVLAGHKLGFRVGASGVDPVDDPPADDGEWLWDLNWTQEKQEAEGRNLVDVPLVVESEWNPNFREELVPDFQKLMVARAWLRVMIIEVLNRSEAEAKFNKFIALISKFAPTQAGDRYLFAAFIHDPAVLK